MTTASTPDARPARDPIPVELWVLVVSAFLIAIGFGMVAPVLPQFARSFDVGLVAASAIVSVFALVRLVFAPAGGSLINRFGERRIYLWGLAVVAASSVASGLATNYGSLLLFRGIGGVGSVMFTVSSMGLLVRISPPHQRGRLSSLYGSAFLLGNIAGPILGASLARFGLRVPFFIYSGLVGLAIVVVMVFLRSSPTTDESADQRPLMTLRDALATPGYPALLMTAFAHGGANFGVRIALMPLMAAAIPTIGMAAAGWGLTLFAAGNAVAQQASGRLADKVGRVPVLLFGLVFSALATFWFGWATTRWAFLVLCALAGVGAAFVAPALQALMGDFIGTERRGGQALSSFSMATDLGSIIATLGAGAIAQAIGFGWAFFSTGVILALAAVPWLVTKARGRTAQKLA